MLVRSMQQADIPVVAAWLVTVPLWQRYRLAADKTAADLEQALHRSDSLLVADDQGRACGLAWSVCGGAFGRSPYLRLLGVEPGHNGQGIGALLLDATEQVAARTARELFLLVSDFNRDAQRFYQRQGYTQIGAIPGYVLPDVTELLYWKRLEVQPA